MERGENVETQHRRPRSVMKMETCIPPTGGDQKEIQGSKCTQKASLSLFLAFVLSIAPKSKESTPTHSTHW